jgi:hypothetical protein
VRVDAKWSGQLKNVPADDQGSQMYGGVGWLVDVTPTGYVLEVGSKHEVAPRSPSGERFTIHRDEATAIKLKLRLPESADWVRHDDPRAAGYLETGADPPGDAPPAP